MTALPLRMKSCAVIFGKACDSARTTCRPFARVTDVRFGQATGRSGPRAGAEVACGLTAGIVLEVVGVIGRLHLISQFPLEGAAHHDSAIARDEIFLRDGLHLRGRDGEKAVEHRVDAIGIAVEKREACEIVHEAEARHIGTHAAFEHRVVIGAEV